MKQDGWSMVEPARSAASTASNGAARYRLKAPVMPVRAKVAA